MPLQFLPHRTPICNTRTTFAYLAGAALKMASVFQIQEIFISILLLENNFVAAALPLSNAGVWRN